MFSKISEMFERKYISVKTVVQKTKRQSAFDLEMMVDKPREAKPGFALN